MFFSPNHLIRLRNRRSYLKLRAEARRVIVARLEHFNKIYNLKYNRIAIRDQRSRWGSCSSKGNLNFNYKLLMLPEELRDYVIVHELCHIAELNHSPKFWAQVERAMPEYRVLRRKLRGLG